MAIPSAIASTQRAWRSPKKQHIEDVINADPIFDPFWQSSQLLAVAESYLGGSCYVMGARYRAPISGYGEQTLHRDDAGYDSFHPRVLNAIIPLVAFTAANGATRVIPGSHQCRENAWPVPDDPLEAVSEEKLINASAGDALLFGGGLLHSGTRNVTPIPRHAIAVSYVRRNKGLSRRTHLSDEGQARLGSASTLLDP